jgi:hypothetical protein
MTPTVASPTVASPTVASAAVTSSAATPAERYARNYGRKNNDDNSDARFRHCTLAAPASLLH